MNTTHGSEWMFQLLSTYKTGLVFSNTTDGSQWIVQLLSSLDGVVLENPSGRSITGSRAGSTTSTL